MAINVGDIDKVDLVLALWHYAKEKQEKRTNQTIAITPPTKVEIQRHLDIYDNQVSKLRGIKLDCNLSSNMVDPTPYNFLTAPREKNPGAFERVVNKIREQKKFKPKSGQETKSTQESLKKTPPENQPKTLSFDKPAQQASEPVQGQEQVQYRFEPETKVDPKLEEKTKVEQPKLEEKTKQDLTIQTLQRQKSPPRQEPKNLSELMRMINECLDKFVGRAFIDIYHAKNKTDVSKTKIGSLKSVAINVSPQEQAQIYGILRKIFIPEILNTIQKSSEISIERQRTMVMLTLYEIMTKMDAIWLNATLYEAASTEKNPIRTHFKFSELPADKRLAAYRVAEASAQKRKKRADLHEIRQHIALIFVEARISELTHARTEKEFGILPKQTQLNTLTTIQSDAEKELLENKNFEMVVQSLKDRKASLWFDCRLIEHFKLTPAEEGSLKSKWAQKTQQDQKSFLDTLLKPENANSVPAEFMSFLQEKRRVLESPSSTQTNPTTTQMPTLNRPKTVATPGQATPSQVAAALLARNAGAKTLPVSLSNPGQPVLALYIPQGTTNADKQNVTASYGTGTLGSHPEAQSLKRGNSANLPGSHGNVQQNFSAEGSGPRYPSRNASRRNSHNSEAAAEAADRVHKSSHQSKQSKNKREDGSSSAPGPSASNNLSRSTPGLTMSNFYQGNSQTRDMDALLHKTADDIHLSESPIGSFEPAHLLSRALAEKPTLPIDLTGVQWQWQQRRPSRENVQTYTLPEPALGLTKPMRGLLDQ